MPQCYRISHVTKYAYSSPVSVCQNVLALSPRNDAHVQCLSHRLKIDPQPSKVHSRSDFFGNQLTEFCIDESHDELVIAAYSRVTVHEVELFNHVQWPEWQQIRAALTDRSDSGWLAACVYSFDSPRIRRAVEYSRYAQACFGSGVDLLTGTQRLCQQIHADFRYDTQATNSATPTDDVFRLQRGVCQDFAHVAIACLRSLGLPARYVSGYLRTIPPTGGARLIGADQSHAWVSVYAGQSVGWIDFDPTNNCLCQLHHIPIAWGRDYTDVVPVRGAYLGGGDSRISVAVDVKPEGLG
ncbi:MAG: transglutaminase family protein [Pirellulaceae bacterium]|nr:transglutaminase family protein [Pirellulaceae bacterium]